MLFTRPGIFCGQLNFVFLGLKPKLNTASVAIYLPYLRSTRLPRHFVPRNDNCFFHHEDTKFFKIETFLPGLVFPMPTQLVGKR